MSRQNFVGQRKRANTKAKVRPSKSRQSYVPMGHCLARRNIYPYGPTSIIASWMEPALFNATQLTAGLRSTRKWIRVHPDQVSS